jgi:hypothetical protein
MILRTSLLYHNTFYLNSAVRELGKNCIESYLPFGGGQRYIFSYGESEIQEHKK